MLRTYVLSLLVLATAFTKMDAATAATVAIANLKTNDLGFSGYNGQVYASVPDSSLVSPNSLMPIDPHTAALGTPIPIGFNPGIIAVASDGTNVFTAIGDACAVQRYNLPTAAADQLFAISGGPQIGDMLAVPGRPNAILLHEFAPGTSPPAVATVVYENAVLLPHQVGHGVGVGGPDQIAIDPTDGTKAYGYQSTISSFDNVPMVVSALGVDTNGPSALQGVLTGAVGHITILGDRLFDDHGHIFSMSLGFQIGSFVAGDDYVLDPILHRLFSISTSGSNHTILRLFP